MPDTRTPEPVGWSGGFALHALVRSVPLRAATVPVSTAAPAEAHPDDSICATRGALSRKDHGVGNRPTPRHPSGRVHMIGGIARFILIDKAMSRFLREPVSVRGAAATIVTATGVVVVVSGVLMRLLDHREYPNTFVGMWWASRR